MELNAEKTDHWDAALADAGSPEDIQLVLTSTEPDDIYAPDCFYFPPGGDLNADPTLTLTSNERQQLMATRERPRITIYGESREREFLASARWALELDRQRRVNNYVRDFGELVNASLNEVFSGPGSAVVWHCLPHIKDADLAAAYLVERRLGPQTGDLWGPYGIWLRTDRPPPDPTTAALRLVVTAAMFAGQFERLVGLTLGAQLDKLHPDAARWWRRLLADADFEHLRESLRFYIPTTAEIRELLDLKGQAAAWRGWEKHFYITLDHGRSVVRGQDCKEPV